MPLDELRRPQDRLAMSPDQTIREVEAGDLKFGTLIDVPHVTVAVHFEGI